MEEGKWGCGVCLGEAREFSFEDCKKMVLVGVFVEFELMYKVGSQSTLGPVHTAVDGPLCWFLLGS